MGNFEVMERLFARAHCCENRITTTLTNALGYSFCRSQTSAWPKPGKLINKALEFCPQKTP
jgi:hypothetical protein